MSEMEKLFVLFASYVTMRKKLNRKEEVIAAVTKQVNTTNIFFVCGIRRDQL